MKHILSRIAAFCYEHYWLVLTVIALLTGAAFYYMLQIKISSNNMDLLPQDSRLIKDFWEVNEDFGAQDRHIVLIETPDSLAPEPELIKDFAHRFEKALMQTGLVKSVSYSLTEEDQAFIEDFFFRNALLYISGTDLDSVIQRLEDREIEKRILMTRNILSAPVPPPSALKKTLRDDPLLLSEIFLPYVEKILGSKNAALIESKDSYYFSKDRRTLLMFVKPVTVATDTRFSEIFVERNIQLKDSLFAAMGESANRLAVTFGGNFVSALSNARAVKQGLINSSLIVIILIVTVFYLFYGDLRSLFIILLPIITGVVWVFSAGDMCFEKVNIITAASGAMLLGLGVDYALHIYNRFVEQESYDHHRSVFENMIITFRETGVSVFYGAVSTSFVFAVLMITEFRGLFELGFIGGLGILILFIAVLLILPAEIRLRGRRSARRRYLQTAVNKVLGLNARLVLRHPKYITTGSILIALLMAGVLLNVIPSQDEGIGVTFDENIENIRSKNDVDLQLIRRLQEKFGTHFKPVSVVATGTSDEELIHRLKLLNTKLDTLSNRGMVMDYSSMLRYIPTIQQQRENLEKIKGLDVESILFKVRLEMARQGLKMNYFRLDRLRNMLTVREPVTISMFQQQRFSEIMRHFYIEKQGIKKVVTQVQLTGNSYEIDIVNDFVRAINQDSVLKNENYVITGIRVMTAEFLKLVKKDLSMAFMASLVAVIMLVVIKYRNLKAILVCLVPLVFSVLVITGGLRLFGIKINFVNMIAIPLLIGTGVDYGIYIISRYLEDRRHDVMAAIQETGQSIFLSALTTMIGFSSLTFVDNRGLSSLGYMCTIGIFISVLSSVIILPAMLRLWGKRIWKEVDEMEVRAQKHDLGKTQSIRKKQRSGS